MWAHAHSPANPAHNLHSSTDLGTLLPAKADWLLTPVPADCSWCLTSTYTVCSAWEQVIRCMRKACFLYLCDSLGKYFTWWNFDKFYCAVLKTTDFFTACTRSNSYTISNSGYSQKWKRKLHVQYKDSICTVELEQCRHLDSWDLITNWIDLSSYTFYCDI